MEVTMKRTLIVLIVFVLAVLAFCLVTGIAAEIHANGFYWPKIREMLRDEDRQIWVVLPIACIAGTIGYCLLTK